LSIIPTDVKVSNEELIIGSINNASCCFFDGDIDELRIWNIARSKIQATMNDTLGPEYYLTADSGLIGYWRFNKLENLGIGNDGLTDDLRDLSINGNHGDLAGDAMLVPSDVLVGIAENLMVIPIKFFLSQNYPNPFNPSTKITFALAQPAIVTLEVYNTLGQKVATLLKKRVPAGNHEIEFNAHNLPSGIYYYKIQTGEFRDVKKMVLLK